MRERQGQGMRCLPFRAMSPSWLQSPPPPDASLALHHCTGWAPWALGSATTLGCTEQL